MQSTNLNQETSNDEPNPGLLKTMLVVPSVGAQLEGSVSSHEPYGHAPHHSSSSSNTSSSSPVISTDHSAQSTSQDEGTIIEELEPEVFRTMLIQPSVATRLESFKLLRDSSVREEFISCMSDPLRDVSRRLIVGKWLAGGAQGDVLEGRLLTGEVDEASIQEISQDEEQPDKKPQRIKVTVKKVAIKVPRYYTYTKNNGQEVKSVLRELEVWKEVDHPNLLRLRGLTFANDLPAFVADWMDKGTLRKYRAANPDLDAKFMAIEIATGIEYLHQRGIVHADLKADNILISNDGRPILADFGVSRFVSVDGEPPEASYEGSLRWMARELIWSLATGSGTPTHTKESDVWAFGMVLYELLSARLPYGYYVHDAQVMSSIASYLIPPQSSISSHATSDELWYLCQRCWEGSAIRWDISQLITGMKTEVPPDPLDSVSVPAEFMREQDDTVVVYNPDVSRSLDVELMDTLYFDSEVLCVRFSMDGRYIATGCHGMAYVYEAETGENICNFEVGNTRTQRNNRVWSVCFSPDGKFLATGSVDELVRIWDIAEKRIHRVFEGHTDWIRSVCFSCNDRFIVSGSVDETVRIWEMESDNVRVLSTNERYGPYASVRSVVMSADGKLVAGGCEDNVVRIWDANTSRLLDVLKGHTNWVQSVIFTVDGKGLVSGSRDRTVKHWDLTAVVERLRLSSHADFHPNIDTEPTKGAIKRGSVRTLDFTGHKNYVASVAVSPDGQWVASGSQDRDVRIWNSSTAESLMLLRGHTAVVWSVDLNPAGDVLATASTDGRVRLWRLNKI